MLGRSLAVVAIVAAAAPWGARAAFAVEQSVTTTVPAIGAGTTVPVTTDQAESRAAPSTTTSTVASTTTTTGPPGETGLREARASTPLNGLISLAPGSCTGSVSGTYFRMLQPGSRPNESSTGYLVNADSPCADKTYTPLRPGTDGGLLIGGYQPEPAPAFDTNGSSLAGRIVEPASFFGVRFSLSTAATDPQTALAVTAPSITIDGAQVGGDLRALGASWNRGHFNQGAPKPDGSAPDGTTRPSGTYDATTGAIAITWTSAIVGGPFNGFTGEWHLAGRVTQPSGAGAPATVVSDAEPAAAVPDLDVDTLAATGTRSGSTFVLGALLLAVGATALAGARQRRLPASTPPVPSIRNEERS